VHELHESVEIVMTWPISDMTALDETLSLGVTGIISDATDVLAEVLRRRRMT
jgi:hypothetical protein